MYRVSLLEKIIFYLGFAGFFIGPIAWIIFIVSCFRMKHAYSDAARKRRRSVRTVSLIIAILFTILALSFIFLALSFIYFFAKGEGGTPLPTNIP